jgi:hypothetical protein
LALVVIDLSAFAEHKHNEEGTSQFLEQIVFVVDGVSFLKM